MPEFGPCGIRYTSPTPLVVVYDRVECNNSGGIANVQYWNHAGESWEAGPMDPAKHAIPLIQLAADGPYSKCYVLFTAEKPFRADTANAAVFRVDDAGAPAENVDNVTGLQERLLSGTI